MELGTLVEQLLLNCSHSCYGTSQMYELFKCKVRNAAVPQCLRNAAVPELSDFKLKEKLLTTPQIPRV